jgi:hypothetical protein
LKSAGEKLWRRSEGLAERLLRHVVPIFRGNGARNQQSHGTGFLISNSADSFLISAAHVFDPMESGADLFFYTGHKRILRLPGQQICRTTPPAGRNRSADRLDVGVLRLEKTVSPPYPEVNKETLPINALLPRALPRERQPYLLTGFPGSKTQLHRERRQVEAKPYANWSTSASKAAYGRVGCDAQNHIVMPFNRRKVLGARSAIRAFPNPAGMSGSPLWLLPDVNGTNDPTQTPAVGIFIEYHSARDLLVATDISVALDMINRGF